MNQFEYERWLRDNYERIHEEAERDIQILSGVADGRWVEESGCTELTCPHHGEANRRARTTPDYPRPGDDIGRRYTSHAGDA